MKGDNVPFEVTDVSIENSWEEEDETPVLVVEPMEDGWNIRANRLGTAVVELAYIDISGEVQHYSYKIDVNEDKFTLELNPDESVRLHMEYDETVWKAAISLHHITKTKNVVISGKLLLMSKETVEKQKNVIRFVLPARSGKLLQIFQQQVNINGVNIL